MAEVVAVREPFLAILGLEGREELFDALTEQDVFDLCRLSLSHCA